MEKTAEQLMSSIRLLTPDDYHKGYKELFSTLSHCGELSQEEFADILNTRTQQGWITWVLEDTIDRQERIIATISLLYERKIYREGRYVGHIEDVIVLPEYQHHKLGTRLNKLAIDKAREHQCYKIILDCKEDLEAFYSRAGLQRSNIQMAQYF